MKMSGTRRLNASYANANEPKDCPSSVNRGYVLAKGRVVAQGTAEDLLGNAQVREAYFGEAAR